MCYIKAREVLPSEIIELIQEYVEGECIYIPKKNNTRKSWGTANNTREKINERDLTIYNEYVNGTSRIEIAKKYFLSKKSIDRIILKIKSK